VTEAVLGVDVGTTDTKALVFGVDGRELGFARVPTTWTRYADGRSETTGEALLGNAFAAVKAALAEAGAVRVLGLGVTGFAESGIVLDRAGRPSTPVIAWFDQRGAAELAALAEDFRAEFPRRVGLPVNPQWTFGKLLWMRAAGLPLEPGSQWLNIPEYIAYALGGDRVSEPSLASRTGLLDQETGKPWQDALALAGLEPSFLPEALTAGLPSGRVRRDEVPELAGAVLTVVGHDHPAASVGVGAVGGDELFNSCGTADVLLRSVPRILTDDERETLVQHGIDAGRHVLDGRSVLIGGIRAGLVLRRVLDLLGADRDRIDQAWTGAHAGAVQVTGAGGNDDGVSVLVKDGASPDAVWAAALDHIGDVTSALLNGMNSVVGPQQDAVAAGGWTRMSSVRGTKLRLLPGLRFSALEQPGSVGAALFAAWAAAGNPGQFLDFAEPLRRNAFQSRDKGVNT
jgi:sugar (pentulose or hexulose) kinase